MSIPETFDNLANDFEKYGYTVKRKNQRQPYADVQVFKNNKEIFSLTTKHDIKFLCSYNCYKTFRLSGLFQVTFDGTIVNFDNEVAINLSHLRNP